MIDGLAIIGFGEVGSAFAEGWGLDATKGIRAYDAKSDDPQHADEMAARYAQFGVQGCASVAEALEGASLVLCAVTADQALEAAEAASRHIGAGTYWCDLNSCAPFMKRRAAEAINEAGGRYVDVAVMAPVHPDRNLVPLLVAGEHAEQAGAMLERLPMSLRTIAGGVGAASTIKMVRSVFVKGLEALTAELAMSAAKAGVEEEVFESIQRSHPGTDWKARASYNIERMVAHGERRAEEMEQVAKTIEDMGLPNDMTRAAAEWQKRLAGAVPDPDRTELQGSDELDAASLFNAVAENRSP